MLNLTQQNNKPTDYDEEFRNLSDDGLYSVFSDDYTMPDSKALVDFLFERSKLDPLIQIQRDDDVKCEKLKKRLQLLIEETTLDREQLKSFIEALVEPVHLTQGPPGTGKSYLGMYF